MDKTKENILMCEKATEIQALWIPDCGDVIVLPNPDDRIVIVTEHLNTKPGEILDRFVEVAFPKSYHPNRDYKKIKGATWLPRQDQLQEMLIDTVKIGDTTIPPVALIGKLVQYYENHGVHNYTDTFEQYWLCIVMKEKYNKVWNGNDWI